MIAAHLKIQPGQQALTPEQEAEAKRFAQARIAAQLSTESVDEPETGRLVQQAYAAAHLPPPPLKRIQWVDGPLCLLAALPPSKGRSSARQSVWASVAEQVRASVLGAWITVRR